MVHCHRHHILVHCPHTILTERKGHKSARSLQYTPYKIHWGLQRISVYVIGRVYLIFIYTIHTMHILQYIVYIHSICIQYIWYIQYIQYIIYSIQYALYSIQYIVYSIQYVVYILYTIYYIVYNIYYILFTIYMGLQRVSVYLKGRVYIRNYILEGAYCTFLITI